MDAARLNFSHGDHASHEAVYRLLRETAKEAGMPLAILMDLQGPKIRTGALASGREVLEDGAAFCITARDVPGNAREVSTCYKALSQDVRAGDRILLADGTLELRVERVDGPDVHCRVSHGGPLGPHKGINLPGVAVSAPALTDKDIEDLRFGLRLGVDYVALSFVRRPEDLSRARDVMCEEGRHVPLVAKIERPEALDSLDEIIALADGVMVARGDLGVELPLEEVPQMQKDIIRRCNARGVPVITATQMLESMMTNARPTRAEAADIANAIHDGTDAVMLSGETANGAFPVLAVETMASIAERTDAVLAEKAARCRAHIDNASHVWTGCHAIGSAVQRLADTLPLRRIVVFTQTGHSARTVARFRPTAPITALTLSESTQRRCALYWGVEAARTVELNDPARLPSVVDDVLIPLGLAAPGDAVLVVAGMPLAVGGRTNFLYLHEVASQPQGSSRDEASSMV